MSESFKILIILTGIVFLSSCKEPYFPPVENKDVHYLVVEGVISDGSSVTTINLSRTTDLSTKVKTNELHALVFVEDEANGQYSLPEIGNGLYSSTLQSLQVNKRYRLRIRTAEGKEYISDFETLKKNPEIDNVGWRRSDNGVAIGISTHDAEKQTRYYRWIYSETWEFHSPYLSVIDYVNQRIVDRDQSIPITTCWKSASLKSILINSSAKLNEDIVTNFQLINIPQGDWKISVLYSMLVKQYAMSESEYLYWEKIKKNTEEIGSIFDPQPSEIPGNLHCISNPAEPVIGFVGACVVREKRIYISRQDVEPWNYRTGCTMIDVPDHPDSLRAFFGGQSMEPIGEYRDNKGLRRYSGAAAECIDCRLKGTNVPPAFWP